MSLTYSYDQALTRPWLDHARSLIGDTDVTVVTVSMVDTYPYTLMADDTYLAAFTVYGWNGGLISLLRPTGYPTR